MEFVVCLHCQHVVEVVAVPVSVMLADSFDVCDASKNRYFLLCMNRY